MNICPNPSYKGIRCPHALTFESPLPCCGTDEECKEWRDKLETEYLNLPLPGERRVPVKHKGK